jgi:hypothetical protein
MTKTDPKPDPNGQPNADQTVFAREWEHRLFVALGHETALPEVAIRRDGVSLKVAMLDDKIGVVLGLYFNASALHNAARVRLWVLALAKTVTPYLPSRRWVLILAPLGDQVATAKTLDTLTAEAKVMGMDAVHVSSPEQAAAVIHGQEIAMVPPDEDGLSSIIV